MAGSYNHVVTDDGNLGSIELVTDMLENGGDVYEAVEEMFGMVWYLARMAVNPQEAVEAARQGYKQGLEFAREVNRGS